MRLTIVAAVLLSLAPAAFGQTPEIATCRDGTTQAVTQHRGACSRHRGVESYAPAPASAARTDQAVPPVPASPPPAQASGPASAAPAPNLPARPTAGSGQVWVNTASKVYHCPGGRWYGKTKAGKYTTEAAARAEGDRPDHGKACF